MSLLSLAFRGRFWSRSSAQKAVSKHHISMTEIKEEDKRKKKERRNKKEGRRKEKEGRIEKGGGRRRKQEGGERKDEKEGKEEEGEGRIFQKILPRKIKNFRHMGAFSLPKKVAQLRPNLVTFSSPKSSTNA